MTETNVPASGGEPEEVGVEVPEADAVEQAQGDADVEVTPRAVTSIPDDVPEADALEQSYEVNLHEDY